MTFDARNSFSYLFQKKKEKERERKKKKRKLGENILISNSRIDHFFFAAEIYIQISWNDDIRF